jgi:hypothetical protein
MYFLFHLKYDSYVVLDIVVRNVAKALGEPKSSAFTYEFFGITAV